MKVANLGKFSDSGLTIGCTKEAIGKGKRLIITDAMTKDGPLTGTLMIFKANKSKKSSKKGRKGKKSRPSVSTGNEDNKESCVYFKVQLVENNNDIVHEEKPLCKDHYHESMTSDRYEKYFSENICSNGPANSAIVIDNERYSKDSEHCPTFSWRKQ